MRSMRWLDQEKTMTVLLLMSVISAGALTFLVCFFTAVSKECTGRKCRVVRISRAPLAWSGEGTDLRYTFGR